LAKWRVAIAADKVIYGIQPRMERCFGESSHNQICDKKQVENLHIKLEAMVGWRLSTDYWAQQSSLSRYAAPRPQLVYKRGSGVGSAGSGPEAVALQR